jgi:lambda repressor-like predicted transcriptional regulator
LIEINQEIINAVLRHKGMMTMKNLSKSTGINRYTLHDILTNERKIVQKSTYNKLITWLAKNS